MTESPRWYAVSCPAGQEWRAACAMMEAGIAPWFWYTLENRLRGPAHRRRQELVPVAYFSGYLFAPATRSNVKKVRECEVSHIHLDVVTGGHDNHPLEIAHKDLMDLATAIGLMPNGMVVEAAQEFLEAGQRIRVAAGPLKDFMAVVERTVPRDGKSPVAALIDLFGGASVTLGQGQVETV